VLVPESLEDRFHSLEQNEQVELLLAEMKTRALPAASQES
jgi:hypothetical protein